MSPTCGIGKGTLSKAVILTFCLLLLAGSAKAYWDGYNPYAMENQGDPLYALQQPNIFYHNVGLLEVLVTNVGVVGNPGLVDSYGAGWRGGEYLYAAALWLGAIASDNLAYVSTGAYEYELRPSLDPIDTIYPTFEGSTGGDRPGFSSGGGDDDQDGLVDEDYLNGRDDDDDGRIDEDFGAISQQMFCCEYWDYTEEAAARNPDHRPLYLRIRQTSFAWSNDGANEFIGLQYRIVNEGHETLRQVYLGYFVDSDAGLRDAPGFFSDDGGAYVDTTLSYTDHEVAYSCLDFNGDRRECSEKELHISIAYMRDTPGSQTGGNAADDMGPGSNGYFGGMFLGHTTDPFGVRAPSRVEIYTCRFFSGSGTYPLGDPSNDFERYDLLSSGEIPRRPTTQAADYRYCFSAGPFTELLPGEELNFQVAFVVGNEWSGLLFNALKAQRIYNGKWRDTDGNPLTGCGGSETCLAIEPGGDALRWDDPCDSLAPVRTIKNTECVRLNADQISQFWVDDDCNCCTPEQINEETCDGWETLIHWVWTVAPPPPSVNTESDDPVVRAYLEGDRSVNLKWNNASELVADPDTGAILFCGYRVWRVEGWTRPIGSTGPSPDDWQLIADLAVDPVGSKLDLYAPEHFNDQAVPADTIPHPGNPGASLLVYPVGRYTYTDSIGIKNGMLYFYDVTSYSCWHDSEGFYNELTNQPAASENEGVRPRWLAVGDDVWENELMVVPNPWRGGAAWDLTPSDSDPTGTHIDFAGLPDSECDVRIYSLSGDLVHTLHQDPGFGAGTLSWNMISRNGQDITSGVYLYAVSCGGKTVVKRFTIIR
jgi:hypothetical protein